MLEHSLPLLILVLIYGGLLFIIFILITTILLCLFVLDMCFNHGKKQSEREKQANVKQKQDGTKKNKQDLALERKIPKGDIEDVKKSAIEKYSSRAYDESLSQTKKETGNEKQILFTKFQYLLNEINNRIMNGEYGSIINPEWKNISMGDGKTEIGREIALKEGNGNIIVKSVDNEHFYIAIPNRGKWRGREFKLDDMKECYEVSSDLQEDQVYNITRIEKPAILRTAGKEFKVLKKGKLKLRNEN